MKILITGGAGFIGSRCAAWLRKQGHDIVILDNMSYGSKDNLIDDDGNDFNFILGDVRDENLVNGIVKEQDVILHFAAIAPLPDNQKDPNNSYQNNVIGTINVLEACRKFGTKKFVLASTSAVYENNDCDLLTEDLQVKPTLTYAASKQAAEQISLAYYHCYGLPVSIVRFFNVYGPHQDYKRKSPPLMGYITRELILNKSPILHSDGSQRRDYVHVTDLCKLVECVINDSASVGEIFNACSGMTRSVKEIFDLCAERVQSDLMPIFRESDKLWSGYPELFDGCYHLKNERIKKETEKYAKGSYTKSQILLGWTPEIDFREGVFESVDEIINSMKRETNT